MDSFNAFFEMLWMQRVHGMDYEPVFWDATKVAYPLFPHAMGWDEWEAELAEHQFFQVELECIAIMAENYANTNKQ